MRWPGLKRGRRVLHAPTCRACTIQEFLPLLPVLLDNLNRLLAVSHKTTMRELFVELCLTVPVRLSALLPHLHFLMRPLVLALQVPPAARPPTSWRDAHAVCFLFIGR